VRSSAAAAHLLNHNAGVLRGTRDEQKPPVEQEGKLPLILIFSVNTNHESVACRFKERSKLGLDVEVCASTETCPLKQLQKLKAEAPPTDEGRGAPDR
jgi:hypothetical protein